MQTLWVPLEEKEEINVRKNTKTGSVGRDDTVLVPRDKQHPDLRELPLGRSGSGVHNDTGSDRARTFIHGRLRMNVIFVIAGVMMVLATIEAVNAMTEYSKVIGSPRRWGLALLYLTFSSLLGGLLLALHGMNSLGGG